MRVGFLINQLDNRGTGNALFDYAYYNETILGNKSYIYTYRDADHNAAAVDRFTRYFPIIVNPNPLTDAVDVMYHIKSGEDDGVRFPRTHYVVHAVFNARQKHGSVYAAVSRWLGGRDGVPWVSHIVSLPYHTSNLRDKWGIPSSAIVFGRHGGYDTFDIPWAWSAVKHVAETYPNKYFIFMNTDKPDYIDHKNIIFLPETAVEVEKRRFINTCDAMLHARMRGETFGLSVGEFGICGKPIFSYKLSPERAHIDELQTTGQDDYLYKTEEDLRRMLVEFTPHEAFIYTSYYPDKVMEEFNRVFLQRN
jgi:glycosyltransferase involved in cell wall biosynthesis